MDLIDQVDLTVTVTEFIFGIDQDQSASGCNLCTTFEELYCIFFKNGVVGFRNKSLFQDFFFGDIFVVSTDGSFRCRGDDRFRETLVFAHTFRQFHTADFAYTAFVSTPCATAKVTAYDHFNRETFALHTNGNHWVG